MLSKQSLEILLDLVEIKISTIIIQDKDDIKELRRLKNSRNEIFLLMKEHKTKIEMKKCQNMILNNL